MNSQDVINQFFESPPVILQAGIGVGSEVCIAHYLDLLRSLSDVFEDTVYVIDFQQRCFRYVSNKGPFLYSHRPDEVLQSGYHFYAEVIHPDDYRMLVEIHRAVVRYFSHPDTPIHDLSYVVFDIRLRGYTGKIMLSHKVFPLVVNGQANLAVCCVSSSTAGKPGNLFAYYRNQSGVRYCYSFENKLWEQAPVVQLRQLEWEILCLSKQGISDKELSDITGISYQTLRNTKNIIYKKLNVHSMIQAILFSSNHKIHITPNYSHHHK